MNINRSDRVDIVREMELMTQMVWPREFVADNGETMTLLVDQGGFITTKQELEALYHKVMYALSYYGEESVDAYNKDIWDQFNHVGKYDQKNAKRN